MRVKIRIEHTMLDKKADTLTPIYYDRTASQHRALLKDGTILTRMPYSKDQNNSTEMDELWELPVMTHETTDEEMPAPRRNGREGKYYRKRLVFYFDYENDEEVLKGMKTTNPSSWAENKKWAAFHKFRMNDPEVDAGLGDDGKPINKNRTGSPKWLMTNLSAKSSGDSDRRRVSIEMGQVLIKVFDEDKELFIEMCHGIGLSNQVAIYGTDYNSLFNIASDTVNDNPFLLKVLLDDDDKEYLLAIRKAIGTGYITQSAGAYWVGTDLLGKSEKEIIQYYKLNAGKFAAISPQKLKLPAGGDVVSEADIEKRVKGPSQIADYIRARHNEYDGDEERITLFNERMKAVCDRKGWNIQQPS